MEIQAEMITIPLNEMILLLCKRRKYSLFKSSFYSLQKKTLPPSDQVNASSFTLNPNFSIQLRNSEYKAQPL